MLRFGCDITRNYCRVDLAIRHLVKCQMEICECTLKTKTTMRSLPRPNLVKRRLDRSVLDKVASHLYCNVFRDRSSSLWVLCWFYWCKVTSVLKTQDMLGLEWVLILFLGVLDPASDWDTWVCWLQLISWTFLEVSVFTLECRNDLQRWYT